MANEENKQQYRAEIIKQENHPLYGSNILIKFPPSIAPVNCKQEAMIYLEKDGKKIETLKVYIPKSEEGNAQRIKIQSSGNYSFQINYRLSLIHISEPTRPY